MATENLVKDNPKGVDIRFFGVLLFLKNFGSHVCWCANASHFAGYSGSDGGGPEISDLAIPMLVNQEIVQFDIPVKYVFPVKVFSVVD